MRQWASFPNLVKNPTIVGFDLYWIRRGRFRERNGGFFSRRIRILAALEDLQFRLPPMLGRQYREIRRPASGALFTGLFEVVGAVRFELTTF